MSIMKIKREIINNPSIIQPKDGDIGDLEDGVNDEARKGSNVIIEELKGDDRKSKTDFIEDG